MGNVVRLKRGSGFPAEWGDEALFAAVRAWVLGGDVGKVLGISEVEVRHWVRTTAWQQMTREVMPGVREFLGDQMTRIVAKSLGELEKRMDEGDPVVNLDGSPRLDDNGRQVYRPLRAKDLTDIAVKVMGGEKSMVRGGEEDDEGKITLEELARALKRAGAAKVGRVIDVEGDG